MGQVTLRVRAGERSQAEAAKASESDHSAVHSDRLYSVGSYGSLSDQCYRYGRRIQRLKLSVRSQPTSLTCPLPFLWSRSNRLPCF